MFYELVKTAPMKVRRDSPSVDDFQPFQNTMLLNNEI